MSATQTDQTPTSVGEGTRGVSSPAPPHWFRGHTGLKAACVAVAVFVLVVGAWEWAVRAGITSNLILPAPGAVVDSLRRGLAPGPGSWWLDIAETLKSTVFGFAAGVGVALVLGTVLAYVDVLRLALYPYVIFFQTFPKVAIAPLLVAWLGYGMGPKIVIGALLAFFPTFSNTVTGMSEIDKDELRLMRSLGATKLQELRLLRLPNTLPYIFAAMDVAMVVSLLGVIVGEFVGSSAGLGFRIQDRTAFGDTASVYAVLLILGLMGTLLHLLMVAVKRTVLFRE